MMMREMIGQKCLYHEEENGSISIGMHDANHQNERRREELVWEQEERTEERGNTQRVAQSR